MAEFSQFRLHLRAPLEAYASTLPLSESLPPRMAADTGLSHLTGVSSRTAMRDFMGLSGICTSISLSSAPPLHSVQ